MAALYAKGKLKLNEPFIHESVIGSLFSGSLLREVRVENLPAVIPVVRGTAHIIGIQQFGIDPDDPLGDGFNI